MSAPHGRCPEHGAPVTGGPIVYDCRAGDGHTVRAADVDHEYHGPRMAVAR